MTLRMNSAGRIRCRSSYWNSRPVSDLNQEIAWRSEINPQRASLQCGLSAGNSALNELSVKCCQGFRRVEMEADMKRVGVSLCACSAELTENEGEATFVTHNGEAGSPPHVDQLKAQVLAEEIRCSRDISRGQVEVVQAHLVTFRQCPPRSPLVHTRRTTGARCTGFRSRVRRREAGDRFPHMGATGLT